MKRLLATVSCCLIALAACSRSGGISGNADSFKGLDPSVVAEVLANPVASQKLQEEPEATKASLAQGMVRNFILCRQAFHVYQGWITTGTPPSLGPLPTPTHPLEPSNSAEVHDYAAVRTAIRSGEVEQLRFWLTAQGSCGQWIPAKAGDASGPTIKDVVEGAS
jgi:hypothetical protein